MCEAESKVSSNISAAIQKSDDTTESCSYSQCSHRNRVETEGDKARCRKKGPRHAYERLLYGKGEGEIDPDSCQNQALESFYRGQGIVAESEMDALLERMRTSLPATVRLSKLRPEWRTTLSRLEREGTWSPVQWYPDSSMAWRCSSDDYHHPSHAAFRDWVKEANAAGSLTFQEEVSMLPPLLLDVKPDSCVLDMCSAPGSKTLGTIELMHRGGFEPDGDDGDVEDEEHDAILAASSTGIVVANDSDSKRANNIMLPRLLKLRSPSLVVSVANGAKFPLLSPPGDPSGESLALFDRILVDAPCSGDGTIRKDPLVWRRWSVSDGPELHPLQLRLLCRALSLLRVGGRMVYSTCSLNPLENEAVVAAALAKYGSTVSLVDSSALIPQGLKTRPGLTTWKVPDPQVRDGSGWLTPETLLHDRGEDSTKPTKVRIKASMFPPSHEIADELHKCVRILPCDNDAGGFFCAAIVKLATTADSWTKQLPGVSGVKPLASLETALADCLLRDNGDGNAITSGASKVRRDSLPLHQGPCRADGNGDIIKVAAELWDKFKKDVPVSGDTFHANAEYCELRPNDAELLELQKFYGFDTSGNLLDGGVIASSEVRSCRNVDSHGERSQLRLIGIGGGRIVAVSPGVHRWLGSLGKARDRMKFKQLQLASFGVRIFRRLRDGFGLSAGSRWRPCQQGAELLSSLCSRRKLQLPPAAFLSLLETQRVPMRELLALARAGQLEGWSTVVNVSTGLIAPPRANGNDEQDSGAMGAANSNNSNPGSIEYGGVVVGLRHVAIIDHSSRLWVAAVLNEQGLATFASRAELAGAITTLRDSGLLAPPPP